MSTKYFLILLLIFLLIPSNSTQPEDKLLPQNSHNDFSFIQDPLLPPIPSELISPYNKKYDLISPYKKNFTSEEFKDTLVFIQLLTNLKSKEQTKLFNALTISSHSSHTMIWELIIRPILYVIKKYLQMKIREFLAALLVWILSVFIILLMSMMSAVDSLAASASLDIALEPPDLMLTPGDFGLQLDPLALLGNLGGGGNQVHSKPIFKTPDRFKPKPKPEKYSEDDYGKRVKKYKEYVWDKQPYSSPQDYSWVSANNDKNLLPDHEKKFLSGAIINKMNMGMGYKSDCDKHNFVTTNITAKTANSNSDSNSKFKYGAPICENIKDENEFTDCVKNYEKKKLKCERKSRLLSAFKKKNDTLSSSFLENKAKSTQKLKGGSIFDGILAAVLPRTKELVKLSVMDQLKPVLAPALRNSLTDSLRQSVNATVHRGVSRSLTFLLTNSLTHAVVDTIVPPLRVSLSYEGARAINQVLIPSVTMSVAYVVVNSLAHNTLQLDHFCYYCKKFNSYCYSCYKGREIEYYNNYYLYYYSTYFSKYYTHHYSNVFSDIFVGNAMNEYFWRYEP